MPAVPATRASSPEVTGEAAVNGPDAPAATNQRSAWKVSTVLSTSLPKPATNPARMSVIEKTSDVAATPSAKRRARHCRSRSVIVSTVSSLTRLHPMCSGASGGWELVLLGAGGAQPVEHDRDVALVVRVWIAVRARQRAHEHRNVARVGVH